MAHFNLVISQNAKWGHAGFYIDCHRMTVYRKIFFYKKALLNIGDGIYGPRKERNQVYSTEHHLLKLGQKRRCLCCSLFNCITFYLKYCNIFGPNYCNNFCCRMSCFTDRLKRCDVTVVIIEC